MQPLQKCLINTVTNKVNYILVLLEYNHYMHSLHISKLVFESNRVIPAPELLTTLNNPIITYKIKIKNKKHKKVVGCSKSILCT